MVLSSDAQAQVNRILAGRPPNPGKASLNEAIDFINQNPSLRRVLEGGAPTGLTPSRAEQFKLSEARRLDVSFGTKEQEAARLGILTTQQRKDIRTARVSAAEARNRALGIRDVTRDPRLTGTVQEFKQTRLQRLRDIPSKAIERVTGRKPKQVFGQLVGRDISVVEPLPIRRVATELAELPVRFVTEGVAPTGAFFAEKGAERFIPEGLDLKLPSKKEKEVEFLEPQFGTVTAKSKGGLIKRKVTIPAKAGRDVKIFEPEKIGEGVGFGLTAGVLATSPALAIVPGLVIGGTRTARDPELSTLQRVGGVAEAGLGVLVGGFRLRSLVQAGKVKKGQELTEITQDSLSSVTKIGGKEKAKLMGEIRDEFPDFLTASKRGNIADVSTFEVALNDGRSFQIVEFSKLTGPDLSRGLKGDKQFLGFEVGVPRKTAERVIGRGATTSDLGEAKTFIRAIRFKPRETAIGRSLQRVFGFNEAKSIEVLQKSKVSQIGKNKFEVTAEARVKQIKNVNKALFRKIRSIQTRLERKGPFSLNKVTLTDLKSLINLERRSRGEVPFTSKEFFDSKISTLTTLEIRTLLDRASVTFQSGERILKNLEESEIFFIGKGFTRAGSLGFKKAKIKKTPITKTFAEEIKAAEIARREEALEPLTNLVKGGKQRFQDLIQRNRNRNEARSIQSQKPLSQRYNEAQAGQVGRTFGRDSSFAGTRKFELTSGAPGIATALGVRLPAGLKIPRGAKLGVIKPLIDSFKKLSPTEKFLIGSIDGLDNRIDLEQKKLFNLRSKFKIIQKKEQEGRSSVETASGVDLQIKQSQKNKQKLGQLKKLQQRLQEKLKDKGVLRGRGFRPTIRPIKIIIPLLTDKTPKKKLLPLKEKPVRRDSFNVEVRKNKKWIVKDRRLHPNRALKKGSTRVQNTLRASFRIVPNPRPPKRRRDIPKFTPNPKVFRRPKPKSKLKSPFPTFVERKNQRLTRGSPEPRLIQEKKRQAKRLEKPKMKSTKAIKLKRRKK